MSTEPKPNRARYKRLFESGWTRGECAGVMQSDGLPAVIGRVILDELYNTGASDESAEQQQ